MNQNDADNLAFFLNKLSHQPVRLEAVQPLQNGFSGATVYMLNDPDRALFLKIVLPQAGPIALQRMRREIDFYRELACQIPLRLPEFLNAYAGSEGAALLLAAYQPAVPSDQWSEPDFVEVGKQLGEFHARFWNKSEELGRRSWLKPLASISLATDVQQAYAHWQTLHLNPAYAHILTEEAIQKIYALLKKAPELHQIVTSFSITLCHGDCNPTNVLRDSQGHFIWIDWQEVGPGRGPEDLSFFLQRAQTAGGNVPVEAAVLAYHTSLAAHAGLKLSVDELKRGMDAADLQVRLLFWPIYLIGAPEEKITAMLERIFELSDCLIR